jgi:diaminopimelate decarboxylase
MLAIMAGYRVRFRLQFGGRTDLGRRVGGSGDDLMFTSNNTTSDRSLPAAMADGAAFSTWMTSPSSTSFPLMPDLICFRYNPGERRSGNAIIGTPVEAKYGVSHDQLIQAYARPQDLGVKRFGLHTMLASNERDYTYMVQTADMLLERAAAITRLGIQFDFINIGGGLGIPYRPADKPLDLEAMARAITAAFNAFAQRNGYMPNFTWKAADS